MRANEYAEIVDVILSCTTGYDRAPFSLREGAADSMDKRPLALSCYKCRLRSMDVDLYSTGSHLPTP